jgi:hypothetical protein
VPAGRRVRNWRKKYSIPGQCPQSAGQGLLSALFLYLCLAGRFHPEQLRVEVVVLASPIYLSSRLRTFYPVRGAFLIPFKQAKQPLHFRNLKFLYFVQVFVHQYTRTVPTRQLMDGFAIGIVYAIRSGSRHWPVTKRSLSRQAQATSQRKC